MTPPSCAADILGRMMLQDAKARAEPRMLLVGVAGNAAAPQGRRFFVRCARPQAGMR